MSHIVGKRVFGISHKKMKKNVMLVIESNIYILSTNRNNN